jgi:hypothetical protein
MELNYYETISSNNNGDYFSKSGPILDADGGPILEAD